MPHGGIKHRLVARGNRDLAAAFKHRRCESNLRGRPISRILSKGPTLRRCPLDDHSSANRVATAVKLPTRASGLKVPCRGLRRPKACGGPYDARPLFGIAPGGACHTVSVARTVVGSYPTVSPSPWIRPTQAPDTKADSSLWRFPWGCPRRALPGTLPSWSPDFPRGCPRGHPAIRARGGIGATVLGFKRIRCSPILGAEKGGLSAPLGCASPLPRKRVFRGWIFEHRGCKF